MDHMRISDQNPSSSSGEEVKNVKNLRTRDGRTMDAEHQIVRYDNN